MNKLSINLLPQTVLLERIQSSKLSLISKLSIAVLVLVIMLTAAVILFRINQNQQNIQVSDSVKAAENKVASLSSREAVAFALKNRLDIISSKTGSDDKVKQMFNLVIYLSPPEVMLHDIAVDKNGMITASFTSTSLAGIDKLFLDLSNTETNFDLVSKVDLNGVALGRDLTYRFSLRITPK